MALSASDSLSSFDQTAKQLDLEPVLATVLLADTALLGLVGMGKPALGLKHEFNEDSLNDYFAQINLAAGYAAGDTSIVVDDASKLAIGTILKSTLAGRDELIQVTAISSNTLTVTRAVAGTAAAIVDNEQFLIVGMPKQQGDETITDISRARTTDYNYAQEFKRTVKISDQMQAEANNGLHPGVPDELKYQLVQRTLEIKREMNTSFIHMERSGSAPSDSVYSMARGLRQWLVQAGGNHLTPGALNEKAVNQMYRASYDDGGDPGDIVAGPDQITQFSGFNAGKVRVAPSDRVAGVFVNKYLTEFGKELSLTMDRWFQKDEAALIDRSRVYIAPWQGRALLAEPLARIGNAQRWQITGSATFVVKNATKAHCYASGLAVPA